MFRIAHISDPHLGPLPAIIPGSLRVKQRLGHLNWQRNRAHAFDDAIVAAIVDDIQAAKPDHIAVTGDLINLGLPAEVEAARSWLDTLGPPDKVSVIPGNHDAYTGASDAHTRTCWAPFMEGDHGAQARAGARFPYLRRRGEVALIGISTGIVTAPLMATGMVDEEQLTGLATLLQTAQDQALCRVVMIHHPPDNGACPWHKRLRDADAFRDVVATWGAEVILCGHNHRNRRAAIEGPSGNVPVIGVAATSMVPTQDRAGGSWNLVQCSRNENGFNVDITTRGWSADGGISHLDHAILRA